MMYLFHRALTAGRALLTLILVLLALTPLRASAQAPDPSELAETIRSHLTQAQLAFATDLPKAQRRLTEAETTYTSALAPMMAPLAPTADDQARAGLAAANQALERGDGPAFAAARAQVWTALLAGGYTAAEQAILQGDGPLAFTWLPLREFRHATRFSRPGADATVAVNALVEGQASPAEAAQALHADLLDTYQARLTEALHDLRGADAQGFAGRRAESAALTEGYFGILAPAYQQQRGDTALAIARQAFADLRSVAVAGQPLSAPLDAVEQSLRGFRAAPLNPQEQARRAGQMLRFLALVPVEYRRGISNGAVIHDIEVREAITFRDGAAAAFADLQTGLETRDPHATARAATLFAELDRQLAAAGTQSEVADPDAIQTNTEQLVTLLNALLPPEWRKHDNSADFDVIATALDQMEAALVAGQYDLAESARLEAYAILESGPEAKLVVFAPQMKQPIEELFWYGQGEYKGLAQLISQQAPVAEITATRKALDAQLADAQRALAGNNAPMAVASNAAIIVFREGLEAVLILASLMGSLKFGEQRRLRRPLWLGAALAFGASILTWLVARGALTALARYGERLEAVVSLIAIGVLLLITNWFFHNVYWTGWMAQFHAKKKRLVGGQIGQLLGLVVLGFTSIYREGFETVLFLQALVLEAGSGVVLSGVALGLGATLLIGLLVFAVQAKLPHKKMLIVTGAMIGAVLLQMVGNTVHVMQVVGWMPIHPIRWLTLPYWTGMWFGLYATWEGIGLQISAAVFVLGSYVLAERLRHRPAPQARPHAHTSSV